MNFQHQIYASAKTNLHNSWIITKKFHMMP